MDNLQKRGLPIPNRCALCECEEESNLHLFLLCGFSSDLWDRVLQLFGIHWVTPPSVKAHLTCNFDSCWPKAGRILWKATVVATIWVLWLERNSRIFRGSKLRTLALLSKVTTLVTFWASNRNFFAGILRTFFLTHWGDILHHQPQGV
ncbi:hypothetical protein AMTRI_Chr10g228290 [Amborella trichopoda]